jgi:hypothetical protein
MTTIFLAAALAFFATVVFAMLASWATYKAPPAPRKPEVSEYIGPRFTAHGREIQQTGRRII